MMEFKRVNVHLQSLSHWSRTKILNQRVGCSATESLYGCYYTCLGILVRIFSLALNFWDRYMFSPKFSQKILLNILARYLKQTKDHGLVLDPNSDVCKIDAYPYADFL